jgi:phage terminase Nu1 subunit (DNA packaging protein)
VGVDVEQVLKGIRNGRLERSVGTNAKGKPCIADGALAEVEWAKNRDTSKVRGPRVTMATERKRLLVAQARRAELENAKTAGALVSAREVELRWSALVVEARTHFLGIPSRMKQIRPELSAAALLALDNLIREALTELADRGPAKER